MFFSVSVDRVIHLRNNKLRDGEGAPKLLQPQLNYPIRNNDSGRFHAKSPKQKNHSIDSLKNLDHKKPENPKKLYDLNFYT
jgi:hypothetical protein